MRRCQRGNELLIREYAPERSSALINFVPASDKERRGKRGQFGLLGDVFSPVGSGYLEFTSLKTSKCLFIDAQSQRRETFMPL